MPQLTPRGDSWEWEEEHWQHCLGKEGGVSPGVLHRYYGILQRHGQGSELPCSRMVLALQGCGAHPGRQAWCKQGSWRAACFCSPFLQHCSMHTLPGCCPGTPEILPGCCWLLSLTRLSLVLSEKPFSSWSLWEMRLSCKVTCSPSAAGVLPVWADLLQEVPKRRMSDRASSLPLKFHVIHSVHLCEIRTSRNPQ